MNLEAEIEHLHHVRVLYSAGSACLAYEALSRRLFVAVFACQQFERDSLQGDVLLRGPHFALSLIHI